MRKLLILSALLTAPLAAQPHHPAPRCDLLRAAPGCTPASCTLRQRWQWKNCPDKPLPPDDELRKIEERAEETRREREGGN